MTDHTPSDQAATVQSLYDRYHLALKELGKVNKKRDFSHAGEQEYLNAQREVKEAYNDLYYAEQRYLWGKQALR